MALDPGSVICKIVTAGELVCSQVQAQVGHLAAFLDKWQSLLGAFLGAVIGIVGALIVARSATQRSRKIAAYLLQPDLRAYVSAAEQIEGDLENPQHRPVIRLKVVSIKTRRPRPIRLHASEANDILDLDARLSAHLMRCQQLDRELGVALEKYDEAEREAGDAIGEHVRAMLSSVLRERHMSEAFRDKAEYQLSVRKSEVESTWNQCVEHATLANYFLDQLVHGRWAALLVRCRMKLWPNDFDRRSKHLIFSGSVLSAQSAVNVTEPGQSTLTTVEASTSSSG